MLLSSRIRAEVFRHLFGRRLGEWHARGLARQCGISETAVRQELASLTALGLVEQRRQGNRLLSRANTRHSLYEDIRDLVFKTCFAHDVLRSYLLEMHVSVAFVYGETGLFGPLNTVVIGAFEPEHAQWLATQASQYLRRPITIHCVMEEDLARRQQELAAEFAASRAFLIGSETKLARLG